MKEYVYTYRMGSFLNFEDSLWLNRSTAAQFKAIRKEKPILPSVKSEPIVMFHLAKVGLGT